MPRHTLKTYYIHFVKGVKVVKVAVVANTSSEALYICAAFDATNDLIKRKFTIREVSPAPFGM